MSKNKLYPLKFSSKPSSSVWGESTIQLCGFEDASSEIANGFLEKNSIFDVIETYMGDLVGENIYKEFGNEFPILLKYLNINDLLSVQVHPDDETAFDRHNCYGKSEAWYILKASEKAKIYMGVNSDISPNDFYTFCKEGKIEQYLNIYHPQVGDFFYIPAGTIHSAGGGLEIVEIQQLSDVTYRLYDWGREKEPSTARETHIDIAFDCIDYKKYDPMDKFVPGLLSNEKEKLTLIDNKYFTINILNITNEIIYNADKGESFILYYCIKGEAIINYEKIDYSLVENEWILIPATFSNYSINPKNGKTKMLEVYIREREEKDNYINENTDPCLK